MVSVSGVKALESSDDVEEAEQHDVVCCRLGARPSRRVRRCCDVTGEDGSGDVWAVLTAVLPWSSVMTTF